MEVFVSSSFKTMTPNKKGLTKPCPGVLCRVWSSGLARESIQHEILLMQGLSIGLHWEGRLEAAWPKSATPEGAVCLPFCFGEVRGRLNLGGSEKQKQTVKSGFGML